MHRALESRAFIAAILAMTGGAFLVHTHPFPDQQIFLRVIAQRAPQAFLSFKYIYYALLFTHPLSHVLDRAFRRLHLHAQSAPRHLAGTPSGVSRSEHEKQAVSRHRRSAQPAQAGAREGTHLAHHSRTRFVYGNRHLGRDRKRQDFVLHASFCGTDPLVQGSRQRKEDRRSCSWR